VTWGSFLLVVVGLWVVCFGALQLEGFEVG